MSYLLAAKESDGLPIAVVAGGAAGGVVVLIVFLIIIIVTCYRRKQSQPKFLRLPMPVILVSR